METKMIFFKHEWQSNECVRQRLWKKWRLFGRNSRHCERRRIVESLFGNFYRKSTKFPSNKSNEHPFPENSKLTSRMQKKRCVSKNSHKISIKYKMQCLQFSPTPCHVRGFEEFEKKNHAQTLVFRIQRRGECT